jgi:hypothetical protein
MYRVLQSSRVGHSLRSLGPRTYLACVLTALAAKDAEGSGWVHYGHTMEPPHALQTLRRSLYECFHRRRDALFELAHAILTADGAAPSPAHLSLQPLHRRGWGRLYAAALWRGGIDEEALRKLLACYPLAGAQGEPPSTPWTRACGLGAMPKPAPSAVSTTILLATPLASPSSPDGPTSS